MSGKLIGLYSPVMGSGKSEVANILATEGGYWNVKFAGPLKDMVRGLLSSMGFDGEAVERMVEGDLKEQVVPGFATVTPRHLMQTLGTDWGREAVDNDLWTKVALMKSDRLGKLECNVVIDDLRFPNEFRALAERGAKLVRIVRPGVVNRGSPRYEGLLDGYGFDVTIINDGSLADLHAKARELL